MVRHERRLAVWPGWAVRTRRCSRRATESSSRVSVAVVGRTAAFAGCCCCWTSRRSDWRRTAGALAWAPFASGGCATGVERPISDRSWRSKRPSPYCGWIYYFLGGVRRYRMGLLCRATTKVAKGFGAVCSGV